ncbi:SDR family oxidoreductase [bacterium]|nr:SDR family oxidoreductase [bacterium]
MIIVNKSYDRPCALVTGASSGIGAAFASRLAQKGFDLILHGRKRKELMDRAKNLERIYGASVEIIIAELSRPEEIRKVEERINSLDRLDMLVNNAGYWEPGVFWEYSPDSLEAMIMVHNVAPVRFIRAALPRMLERDKGDIINVSSLGAYFNMVTLENYGATKAYLISFTESLHVALMGTGIRVQALTPGFTVTEFHSRLGADFTKEQRTWMQPEKVVDESLRALGKGMVVCIPGFKRRFIVKLASMLPRPVYYRIMKIIGEKVKKRWDEIEKKL